MRRLREILPGRWTTSGWETVPLGMLVLVLLTSGAWGVVAWVRPATHPVEIVTAAREREMFHTSWGYKDESGLCQIAEVTLTQGELDPTETLAQFATRCRETVATLKIEFPPDATCPQALPQR